MVGVRLACILLILLGISAQGTASAQSNAALSEELIRSFAVQLGIAPDSADMQRLLTKHAFEHPPGADKPSRIVRHIRGNGGVPLPSEREIERQIEQLTATPSHPVKPFDAPHMEPDQSAHDYVLAQSPQREERMREKLPGFYPRCKANQTLVDEAGALPLEGPVRVSYDILFTGKELLPEHPAKAFGNNTVIRVYDPFDSESVVGIELDQLGVRCLPARIRVTTEGEFRMEGISALHNFDGDPTGKRGYMHDEVKALLAN